MASKPGGKPVAEPDINKYMEKQRATLQKEREALLAERTKLDEQLTAIDRQLIGFTAYERAIEGKLDLSKPKKASTPRGPRSSSKRQELLQLIKDSNGLSRGEIIEKLGISGDTARCFESGYAPKGVLRGRYAVPVRDLKGQLLAYIGIAVSDEQSPHLLFHSFDPRGVIWNVENLSQGADLTVFSDPLHAILAVENGIPLNQVVSFLAPVTAQALVSLAALLDEKQIEAVEFH